MGLHPFNRDKALRKLRFRQHRGQYIKIGTIILSVIIFVAGIIYYSYSKYTVTNKFDVIQTTVGNFKKEYLFDYTGSSQTFTTTKDGYYKVELWGASSSNVSNINPLAFGAYTGGIIELANNEILYVYVGGMPTTYVGGYNGGGSVYSGSKDIPASVGGGSTDIRISNGNWNDATSLKSRIMVASAGGGRANGSNGAYGGTLNGINGIGSSVATGAYACGYGATQIGGGAAGAFSWSGTGPTAGGFGYGGTGGSDYGGGGGSGYYGGGGSGVSSLSQSGGGSGSSFISGYLGCVAITSSTSLTPRLDSKGAECTATSAATDVTCSYHYSNKIFTNGVMKAGNEVMPTHDGTSTMTGNSGNGYAKITYIGKSIN